MLPTVILYCRILSIVILNYSILSIVILYCCIFPIVIFRGHAIIHNCWIPSIVISEGKLGKEEDPPVAEAEGAEQLGITIAIVCVCLPVVLFIIIDATYICQIYDKFKAKSGDKQCWG